MLQTQRTISQDCIIILMSRQIPEVSSPVYLDAECKVPLGAKWNRPSSITMIWKIPSGLKQRSSYLWVSNDIWVWRPVWCLLCNMFWHRFSISLNNQHMNTSKSSLLCPRTWKKLTVDNSSISTFTIKFMKFQNHNSWSIYGTRNISRSVHFMTPAGIYLLINIRIDTLHYPWLYINIVNSM